MSSELQKLEAALFTSGAAVSKKKLADLIGCNNDRLVQLLDELQELRKDSGVVPVDDGSQIVLVTHPALDEFMERTQKEEEESPLSKAAQETLSIVAYAGPIAKIDLDFLRGVNTQYTLRRLAMRGLIRDSRERNTRTVSVTTDFLQHLGVQKVGDLPEYIAIRQSILTGLRSIKKEVGRAGGMSDQSTRTSFSYSYIIACVVFFLCAGVLLSIRSSTVEEFEVKPHEEVVYYSITDEVQGDAAIIYDISEDRIIAGKNPFKPKSIASITKLPAAFIAFSHIDEDDITVINADDFTLLPNTPIRLDDRWRTLDLLEYSLITSSNRGINAVSRTVEEKTGIPLVSMMNDFARQHNLVQTHFVNVTGLDAHGTLAGSESSAFDVARLVGIIVRANDGFAPLTVQKEKKFSSLDELQYTAENTNELVGSILDTVLLSKTGFTVIAGAALVMAIEDDGRQVVFAVFDSTRSGRFDDVRVLLQMYRESVWSVDSEEHRTDGHMQ